MKFGKKSYYASEVAQLIGHGCTANMVGRIANKLCLKNMNNGLWVEDAKATASGDVRHYSTFKYYIEAVEAIRKEYLKRKNRS